MTSRMALGSVSTLAVGAMLLGAMPYLIHRTVGSSQTAPWGAISGLQAAAADVAQPNENDRSQLLKLAALKNAPQTPASEPAPVQPAVKEVNWTGSLAATDPSSQPAPAPEPSTVVAALSQPQDDPAAEQADQGAKPAASPVEAPSPAVKRAAAPRSASDAVNINTASMDTLDRLPGVGRVGHAIMVHRPYRSVEDLLRKRVLRTSDYQKIQSRIRVD